MEMDACRITHAASAACAQRIASAFSIRFLINSLLEFISYLYPLIKIYSPIPTIARKNIQILYHHYFGLPGNIHATAIEERSPY